MEKLTLDEGQRERITSILADCPLFQSLKDSSLPKLLDVAELVRYDNEETVISEGDPSDSFFVVTQGEASVRVKNSSGELIEIGRMPPRTSFGEIGLLLDEPRTATIVAAGELEALRYRSKTFESMSKKIPEFDVGLSRGLALRLKQVSGMIPLPSYHGGSEAPERNVVDLLPAELCQRHRVLPLQVEGNKLTVGMVDDPTTAVMSSIREHVASMELQPVRIDTQFFNEVMRTQSGVKGWTGKAETKPDQPRAGSPQLDAMLERMVAEGASDLHLVANHKPYWRIDGDMNELTDAPLLSSNEAWELLDPVLDSRLRQLFKEHGDVDFAYSLSDMARFRVNLYRDRMGTSAAFRLIPSKVLSLEQLGLPPVLKTFCEMPKGLVLVTGPTGSGKSTTLAAMVDHIKNTRKSHIITIEDPIEFVHESGACLVTQRDVGDHTVSFAQGLKAAMREDPDVVLVGELRDLETISMALETANTGHLVLGTLHTNTAVSTVDRIVDQFPAGQQSQIRNVLADVLRGVVTQTLLRKAGGGRMAVLEILVVNFAVANLIRESKTVQIPNVMLTGRKQGMALLNDELARLVEEKKVAFEEALAAAVDKKDLQLRFRSGVTLAADPSGQGFRVAAVKPSSPGELAGLQRGLMIVEINGKPAAELTLDEARQVFRTDGDHQLAVERGGKRVKVVLPLQKMGISAR
jgi:twitching motility protein PilT